MLELVVAGGWIGMLAGIGLLVTRKATQATLVIVWSAMAIAALLPLLRLF